MYEKTITGTTESIIDIFLKPLGEQLSEVELNVRKTKVFALKRLKDVEETAIYAGKKTEVVLVDRNFGQCCRSPKRQSDNR